MKTPAFSLCLPLAAIFVCLPFLLSAQKPEEKLVFWSDTPKYLEYQRTEAFESISRVLEIHSPAYPLSAERRLALTSLDVLLHDTANDGTKAFMDFMDHQMNKALEALKKPVKKGLRIIKLYNDGFIVKSRCATIAIDMIRGGNEAQRFLSDSLMACFASQCDMLLISHSHGDHFDKEVVAAFESAGKRVFAPWKLDNVQNAPALFPDLDLKVSILDGAQDNMPNNIYIIDFGDKLSIAHTGDQYNREDLEWIDHIYEKHSIDVLLINCWTMELERSIAGFSPKLVITGHENEMGHSINHREAYWLTDRKTKNLPQKSILMTWGEYVDY